MAVGLSEKVKNRFPLKTIDAVIDIFRDQLEDRNEPNLALLSILIGILEHSLTVNRPPTGEESSATPTDRRQKSHTADGQEATAGEKSKQLTDPVDKTIDVHEKPVDSIPAIEFSDVEALYEQFVTLVKGSVDLSCHRAKYTSPELLKAVSDVVWTALTRTYYKDRAHLHTLFTMLTDNKMDCFGMALGVVAACQILGLSDVHLAFSEDHAWAVFGEDEHLSAEITWHGKGTEDRRGQHITESTAEKSWLYLHPLIGNRHVQVAAMVLNINPAINASYDSVEMAILQQKLLWLLYDLGHLERYPLALGILADMEEMSPSPKRPASIELYTMAINIARKHYCDMHVYPYTYMGNYYYRRCMYKEALSNWAAASQVISRYNYNKEDEEIYKEFLEIANDIIPNIVRISSGEAAASSFGTDVENSPKSQCSVPFLSDPECYANLLQFYDGICEWEEGSSKPVLHIVWANHMAYSLSKFDLKARENVNIDTSLTSNNSGNSEAGEAEPRKRLDRRRESDAVKEDGGRHAVKSVGPNGDATKSKPRRTPSRRSSSNQTTAEVIASDDSSSSANIKASKTDTDNLDEKDSAKSSKASSRDREKLPLDREKLPLDLDLKDKKDVADSELEAKATSESGEPDQVLSVASAKSDKLKSAGMETTNLANEEKEKTDSTKLKLTLRSEKMVGMKDLLVSRKLNTSAIKLQLTAQSQLSLKQSQPPADAAALAPPQKRARRE